MSVHAHRASDLKSLKWLMGMRSLHSEAYKSWKGGSSVPDGSPPSPSLPWSASVVTSSFVFVSLCLIFRQGLASGLGWP